MHLYRRIGVYARGQELITCGLMTDEHNSAGVRPQSGQQS